MIRKKEIKEKIAKKRHQKDLRRKLKKESAFPPVNMNMKLLNSAETKFDLLSPNLQYIAECTKTKLLEASFLNKEKYRETKIIDVPRIFSLVDNSKESFEFIQNVINSIYHSKVGILLLDYKNCKEIHLGAQVYLDVLLRDIFRYSKMVSAKFPEDNRLKNVIPRNLNNEDIRKLLFSIGSFAIHRKKIVKYEDIVPYQLCEFKKNDSASILFNIEKKEEHVTTMVQYVIDSLAKLDKELTSDSIDNLSIIIGEILINAEEHSTNKHRFSIGYFQEHKRKNEQYGIFNLVILNFGETIYDKFKDPYCQRPDIVQEMKNLSQKYTSNNLFGAEIKEETLWTLYALQEEVTSVSPEKNIKRGNGSIKFIESFFSLKGEGDQLDNISRLAVLSGNTSIVFDGKYSIKEKIKNGENFKVMTFNHSGNISEKPDPNYVKFVKNHFPGTLISAQILISKNDII